MEFMESLQALMMQSKENTNIKAENDKIEEPLNQEVQMLQEKLLQMETEILDQKNYQQDLLQNLKIQKKVRGTEVDGAQTMMINGTGNQNTNKKKRR